MKNKLILVLMIFLVFIGIGLFYILTNKGSGTKQKVVINDNVVTPTPSGTQEVTPSPEIDWEPEVLKLYDDIISKPIVDKEITGGPLSEEDYHFKGISLNHRFSKSIDAIRKIIGNPNRIEEEDWKDPGIREKIYYYSNFKLVTHLSKELENVWEIDITGRGPKTARGITVGDKENKIIEKYGAEEKSEDCYYYEYVYTEIIDFYNTIQFQVKDGLIKEISIYCAGD